MYFFKFFHFSKRINFFFFLNKKLNLNIFTFKKKSQFTYAIIKYRKWITKNKIKKSLNKRNPQNMTMMCLSSSDFVCLFLFKKNKSFISTLTKPKKSILSLKNKTECLHMSICSYSF
jgi:hypothetical protein